MLIRIFYHRKDANKILWFCCCCVLLCFVVVVVVLYIIHSVVYLVTYLSTGTFLSFVCFNSLFLSLFPSFISPVHLFLSYSVSCYDQFSYMLSAVSLTMFACVYNLPHNKTTKTHPLPPSTHTHTQQQK